jgi:dihydrolipoamide dehydrogenase
MATKICDVIVIGAGPGGYVCAIRLAQLGQSVVCVEKEEVGGTCLNWGCIPSKALISTSHVLEKIKTASTLGIKVDGVSLDASATQDWKNALVKKLTGGIRQLFKANGVQLVSGTARVAGDRQVQVTLPDGTQEMYQANTAIVVATGSSTIELPNLPFDGKQVIGAREAVNLREIPKRLCVIGGGVIGLELGTVFHKFGSELTVVEALPQLLAGVEADCTQVVERKLSRAGVRILKNAKALGYEKQADGSLLVKVQVGDKTETVACDTLLVAVGMRPNARNIGLEEVGVAIDDRGFVRADQEGRTNVLWVYSIGDACGPPLLAHKASKEGEVVAEVIAGHKAARDWVAIPGAIFTDPEIATAGLTTESAKEKGYELAVGKFPFAALGKAMAIGETDGFVKVISDKKTHKVLGVHIVGPSATDLISEAMLAIEMGALAEDIALTVHPHPTLGEALMEASAHALGQAIHTMNR